MRRAGLFLALPEHLDVDRGLCWAALSASKAARKATIEALSSLAARPKSRHSGSNGRRACFQSISCASALEAPLRITGTKGSERPLRRGHRLAVVVGVEHHGALGACGVINKPNTRAGNPAPWRVRTPESRGS